MGSHVVAIKTDGTLWGWGANASYQLGIGNSTIQPTPVQISAATNWAKIACGFKHTAAIKTDGTLWAWGDNSYYELGIGTTPSQQPTPVQVGIATDWANVWPGDSYTIAIK